MKQRVSFGLFCTTVLLTSIVEASVVPRVPSGEATPFPSNPLDPWNPSPSSDQYTPQLRDPPKYLGMVEEEEEEEEKEEKDDDRDAWIRDFPPRINSRNHEKKKSKSDIDFPPNYDFFNNRHNHRQNLENDLRIREESSSRVDAAEAMKLSSLKFAFDEPIDAIDQIGSSNQNEDDYMQGDDVFLGDAAFEDEGPGSVEVYKLDLFKDEGPVTSGPRQSKRKSKVPKKAVWKISSSKDLNVELTKNEQKEEIAPSSSSSSLRQGSSLKHRIFGTGGVPELQVGCEGVEGSQQRQKRSEENKKPIKDSPPTVYENEDDVDYELEEYYDLINGPDDPRYSSAISSRGDMNPMIKTPADIEVRKILLKGQLPKRGDLGDVWKESFSDIGSTLTKKEVRAKRSPRKNREKRKNNRRGKRHGGKKNQRKHNIDHNEKNVIDPKKISINDDGEQILRKIREEEKNDEKLAKFIRTNTPIRITKKKPNNGEYNQLPITPIPPIDIYASERTRLLEEERNDNGEIHIPKYEALTTQERSTISRPQEIREKPFIKRSPEELERLNKLPVSATIIIKPTKSENDYLIDGESKNNEIPNSDQDFQSTSTSSTPLRKLTPPPCVRANIYCCLNFKPLKNCFVENGCAEKIFENPCSEEKVPGALAELLKYYNAK